MRLRSRQTPVEVITPTQEDTRELLEVGKVSFSSILDKAVEIQSMCEDFTVKRVNNQNLMLNEYAGITYMTETGAIRRPTISRYAMGQLCGKIGVPHEYIRKCIGSGRIELAQDNVNSWLEDYNKNLLVRECGGKIRGILSDRYAICDTPDILKVLQDTVDLSTYKVKGYFLNEERLHLRLVGKEMLPIDGEDLFPGIFIDSSDVGRNTLVVQFGIYKLVCTNGLVISRAGGTLFKQKHMGITAEEFHKGLSESLKNVDILTENAVEWVQRTKSRDNHWSVNTDHPEDIEEFVAYIRQQTNLSNESATKVIDLMRTKYEDTRWGLINGITEVAQDFTLERRLELENIAGGLLVA